MPQPAHPLRIQAQLLFIALCTALALARGLSMVGEAQATETAPALQMPAQTYQMALEARTARDYVHMLALLRESAQAGDLRAQELLASVLVAGPSLYGQAVPSNLCEAAMWTRLAADRGSAAARHQLVVLNGLREVPQGYAACKGTLSQ